MGKGRRVDRNRGAVMRLCLHDKLMEERTAVRRRQIAFLGVERGFLRATIHGVVSALANPPLDDSACSRERQLFDGVSERWVLGIQLPHGATAGPDGVPRTRYADASNAVLPISHRRFTCVQHRLLHFEP